MSAATHPISIIGHPQLYSFVGQHNKYIQCKACVVVCVLRSTQMVASQSIAVIMTNGRRQVHSEVSLHDDCTTASRIHEDTNPNCSPQGAVA